MQVIDNIPPTLTFFDVTNRLISYQGGKTDVIVKVSDNGLLRLPQVTLTSPDVTQWRYVAGLKSGTYTNGEFQATVPLPANNTDTDVVYKLNGVVQDTERTWSRVQCLKKTKNDDDKKVNYEKAGTGSSLRAFAHLLSFYIHYPVPTRCCYYNSR